MTKIVSTKGILGGKPRISGTRISVDLISSYIACGYNVKEIKKSYPHLTNDQINSALKYIAKRATDERIKVEPQTT